MSNETIIKNMESHNLNLSKYACKDEEAIYLKPRDKDIRPSYFRDTDRILYSLSFIRYQDKTQVFSLKNHDHIQKRMIHVQFVSKIARTIGRALGLNEDLIEAASLGHDLGHVPFGHLGESILNEISLRELNEYFNHNIESVRNLMTLENYGEGLNISIQVLDAIMCHNGEFALGKYEPRKKSVNDFLEELNASYKDQSIIKKLKPMTLEGCVVRVSDLIAYLGRDIDDAIRLNLIKREDIPENITNILGRNTKEIVNTCILDIINNSINKPYILLSDNIYQAIVALKKYNYENIYYKASTKELTTELKTMFNTLFNKYLKDIETNNQKSHIINSYLANMTIKYKENTNPKRIVIDYIAGMTDDYFISEYNSIKN